MGRRSGIYCYLNSARYRRSHRKALLVALMFERYKWVTCPADVREHFRIERDVAEDARSPLPYFRTRVSNYKAQKRRWPKFARAVHDYERAKGRSSFELAARKHIASLHATCLGYLDESEGGCRLTLDTVLAIAAPYALGELADDSVAAEAGRCIDAVIRRAKRAEPTTKAIAAQVTSGKLFES